MRKLFLVCLVLVLISGVSATTIESESLVLDLENSQGEAEVKITELTSTSFTYITSADVQSVSATSGSEQLECQIQELAIGDEVVCETDLRENFTVNLEYSFSGLINNGGELNTFRYSHPIYRPTKNFNLRVKLPQGTGIAQEASEEPIVPPDGSVGSDGRRIFIEWEKKPQIGDTLNFSVEYEKFGDSQNYLGIIAGVIGGAVILLGGYLYWKRRNMENLESIYPNLSEDEKDIVELLSDNEGEMLQKDVVNSSDYSKAKISGLVSQLVEKEVIEKEKEGRSNKLKISSQYRF